jgi:hypothetical protein
LGSACDVAGDGTHPHDHRSHYPDDHGEHDGSGSGSGSGIDHHENDKHHGCDHHPKPAPRHPGETEYAILRFDPNAELRFPIPNVTTTAGTDASSRSMKFASGPGGQAVHRQCGVPDPSHGETVRTRKVLDAWESKSPGRRQRLLDAMQRSRRHLFHMQQQIANNNNETNSSITNTTANNGTTGTMVKNMVVKVYWHVMRVGNTPQLGMWTKAQAKRSVQLANLYFAHSPILFKLMAITQTINADWFQCKYDKDYATGTYVRVRCARTTTRPIICENWMVLTLLLCLVVVVVRAPVQDVAAARGGRHVERVHVRPAARPRVVGVLVLSQRPQKVARVRRRRPGQPLHEAGRVHVRCFLVSFLG